MMEDIMRRFLTSMITLLVMIMFHFPEHALARPAGTVDPLSDVVSKVSPSVVRIVVSRPPASDRIASNPTVARASDTADTRTSAIGSGFIIDPSGFVATNRHVVENALWIVVVDDKGERFPAKLVGMTAKADMALLHIYAGRPMPFVPLGDSDAMHVGDPVIAIGSPFGFDSTVTSGIISAVNRDIMESPFDDYFQTDAAINHGNSGGPLFNTQGEVIGMNSVIVAPGTGFAGLAFSIPSNDLQFVFDQLIRTGKINCGMLPIYTQQVGWALKQALGAPDMGGALVSTVKDDDGSMLHGQISPGDIIVSFNGEPVSDPRALAKKAAWSPIGSDAVLEIMRGGEKHSVHVTIHAWPQDHTQVSPVQERSLGLNLVSQSHANGMQQVVVGSIDPNGTASDSGIQAGDVVVQVQRASVANPGQAMGIFKRETAAGHPYSAVLIQRERTQIWLAVALPAKS
jgi:serine protease Do